MALNESISLFISQGLQELSSSQISFGLKLMVLFGVVFLFNTVLKTGGSIINLIIYCIAFLKWVILKVMRKDV